jgi:DNA mismatch repair protein MutS
VADFLNGSITAVKRLPPWQFDLDAARRALIEQFETHDLTGFGAEGLTAVALQRQERCWNTPAPRRGTAISHVKALTVEHERAYVRMDPGHAAQPGAH